MSESNITLQNFTNSDQRVGIFILDVNHDSLTFSFANDHFLQYMQVHETHVIHHRLEDVLPKEHMPIFLAKCNQAIKWNKELSFTHDITQIILLPIQNGQQIVGVLFAGSNNAVSHNLPSNISKEFIMQAIDNMPLAMSITDKNNNLLYVNEAFTTLTGYKTKEVIGKKPNILRSDTYRQEFFENMWTSLRESGNWSGEMWHKKKDGSYALVDISIQGLRDENGLIQNHLSIFRDITDRKNLEEKVMFQAYFDELTKLPNRNSLFKYVKHDIQESKDRNFALMLLDLDNFKDINDSLSHSIGDQLLLATTKRLQKHLPESAYITRYGGDEFAILFQNIEDTSACIPIANQIMEIFEAPFQLDNYELYITASIGIVLFPQDGPDDETLLRNVETTMYQAKRNGRNTFMFYDKAYNHHAKEKLLLASDIRNAITHNEFELYYQPQICLVTNQVIGLEALLRWNHPEKGMISPGTFIPIAEETGLIQNIDKWVLLHACLQQKQWQELGYLPIKVSVNLSMIQFQQPDLFDVIQSTLKQTGIAGQYLEIELTESVMMNNPKLTLNNIEKLNSIGVEVSLDDFGTHYSSLSYLKKLSPNRLKIDQSFIRDMLHDTDGQVIVQAMINLAHNLNLKVIAEGVENKEQVKFLHSQRCDEVQGYYFSKPLPVEKINTFIHKRAHLPN
ncbi:EAL domain-containing protein [Virgibacillus soli]|uniref:sensor domain-containing protein n=1 Tax=Paracerasibacillus soli TaxID=480284 RepID=UPI0035EEDE03